MGKAKQSAKNSGGGPFLDAAFICEQVIKEKKDGTCSAIRMVNRITFHEQTFSPGAVVFMPLAMFISFKAGDFTGTRHLSIFVTTPSGKRRPLEGHVFPHPMDFTGGDTGTLMLLHNFPITYETDGTYWIDVLLEKKWYSRIPLTVKTNPS
jgi:hypothetical protein